jgi:hypothetical protein
VEYLTRRQEWIKLLFKDNSSNPSENENNPTYDYVLSQNKPNPFLNDHRNFLCGAKRRK